MSRSQRYRCGYLCTDYEVLLDDGGVWTLKSFVFVYQDDRYGAMLFDTGSPTAPQKTLADLKRYFGLEAGDIRWVFNTHLHIDHVGLNLHLPDATAVFSKRELQFTTRMVDAARTAETFYDFMMEHCPGYRDGFGPGNSELMRREVLAYWPGEDRFRDFDIRFIEDSPAIPECVVPIPAVGHTFDHYMYRLDTSETVYWIVGDAVYNRLEYIYHDDLPDSPQADPARYMRTKAYIKEKEGVVVPGHDRPFRTATLRAFKKPLIADAMARETAE